MCAGEAQAFILTTGRQHYHRGERDLARRFSPLATLLQVVKRGQDNRPDYRLLTDFVEHHDEQAFEHLLERHARHVWSVCCRLLGNSADAEDAFQATFVVLIRSGRMIADRGPLGGWLYRVAYRVALRARAMAARRRQMEQAAARPEVIAAGAPIEPDLSEAVITELGRLPEPCRLAVVLCDVDGLSRKEAAVKLGWKVSTLAGRLERGRKIMARRLQGRGYTVPAVLAAAGGVTIPPSVVASTISLARAIMVAEAGITAIPASVAELASGVLGDITMRIATKVLAIAVLIAGILGGIGIGFELSGSSTTAAQAAPEVKRPDTPATPQSDKAINPQPEKRVRGIVTDKNGTPVAEATVVAASYEGKQITTTSDVKGEFVFDEVPPTRNGDFGTTIMAGKNGFAPANGYPGAPGPLKIVLAESAEYSGTVKDQTGRPVAGAEVQFGIVQRFGNASSWSYMPADGIRGTPLGKFYLATTDADGAFRFTSVPAGAELIFRANAPGFAETDTSFGGPIRQFIANPDAKPARLTLAPEAVIHGRITSQAPDVVVKDLSVQVRGAVHRFAKLDERGEFRFKGLPAGDYQVFIAFPAGAKAVAAGQTVNVKSGETVEAKLEAVEGIEVTGLVRLKGTKQPVACATVSANGAFNPAMSDLLRPAETDAAGRFRLRLPPGDASVFVRSLPPGFSNPTNGWGDQRKVMVPADVKSFALAEPFEVVRVVDGLVGRVTDAAGNIIPLAKVSALQHTSACGNFADEPVEASLDGGFTLKYSPNGPLEPGRCVPLRVITEDGRVFEVNAQVPKEGVAEVRVPTLPKIAGPQEVKPGELAGIVVDENGKPLAGVKVHIWDWMDTPANYTFSGADGVFRLKDCGADKQVQVRFRKEGYSPVMVIRQRVGVKGLVIALDRATYFEGIVRAPDGKPAAGAVIRADQGPKMMEGGMYTNIWTVATADAQGRYRLYVQPDEYEFSVKLPGVGVARLPKTGIGHGQKRPFDIHLQEPITFRAKVVDSISGRPVAGLRLFDWQQKGVDGRSDDRGEIVIKDMLPGQFTFNVESASYVRWWSDQSFFEWQRKTIDEPKTGWQRNFDGLTFDMKPGTAAVTIVGEPAVRVTGRVLDPTGKPVAGATVAPARTGSGNSLTGDTRFSVVTKPDGTFVMTLPASGAASYNLVAHDGKYEEWRTWANGVLPPVKTTPGQVIDGVTLNLTRAAIVRGKVVDEKGHPVAGREVRAQPTDRLENRYYDPTTTTKADGTFELKFIRPTEQFIQAAPFYLNASDGPADSTKTLTLKDGQVVDNVKLVVVEEKEGPQPAAPQP